MTKKVSYITVFILLLPVLLALYLLQNLYALVLLTTATVVLALVLRRHISTELPGPMTLVFTAVGAVLVFFVTIPIVSLFSEPRAIYLAAMDKGVQKAIIVSISASATSTFIAFILALPTSYVLARNEFAGKSVVEGLLDLPVAVPHVVAGIALIAVFGSSGPLGSWDIVDTFWGVVAAMLFVSVPFMVDYLKDGIISVDPTYEAAARTLGATRLSAFVRVVLPMCRRSIATGILITLARGLSEFGAVVIIAYYPMTAPVLIYDRYLSFGGLGAARGASALFLLVILMVFIMLRSIASKDGGDSGGD